ncbi:hypothetical protein AQUCO_06200026v1 [Aquilegia coerulea]|uniref:Deoxyuridine 5'-triphosphate nucleotidohydrolase n=1 Tax=Aquilegia coerulea TaxID=218851 RepID=A0A2G5CE90_AQUCA|nr:hypothetical protein AQUCO_06200026v1 [Aquilegia coerulea]
MANQQNPQTNSLEIKEPSPKIQKIHQNDVSQESTNGNFPLLKVKKLSEKAILPSKGSILSAGYDISRRKALIPTDLTIAIPENTYARVAWNHSTDVGAGVIDADYRGPVGVILFNHFDVDFEVKIGDRIAQLIIEKIMTPEVVEVDDLDLTVRGSGGFGSTGV